LCFVTACYSGTAVEGLPCSETQDCPDGQSCDLDTLICSSKELTDLQLDMVASGASHSCGIEDNKELWCWGRNDFGQLGIGDVSQHLGAVKLDTVGWDRVAAGGDASCGIQTDGSLWCWGDDDVIGVQSNRPAQFGSDRAWQDVGVGELGFCAIDSTGNTWCRWNDDAQLTMVDSTIHAVRVAASGERVCVIDDADQLYCWGNNDHGQVGNGNVETTVGTPYHIEGSWQSVATSATHTCASTMTTGEVWCWGQCEYLEFPTTDNCASPAAIGQTGVLALAANGRDTCMVNASQDVVCMGDNQAGQLGAPTSEAFSLAATADATNEFATVSVGEQHACAITTGGTTFCWGSNHYGQLANGELAYAETPQVTGPTEFESVSVGATTACGIRTDHGLMCWGNNGGGQAGVGAVPRATTPTQVGSDTDWLAVSVGLDHTCGLRGAALGQAALWCWGSNRHGQLGTGNVGDDGVSMPVLVGLESDWAEVAAGTLETCGIRAGGTLWCWGDSNGAPTPTMADTQTGWSSLAATQEHLRYSLGIDALRDGAITRFANPGTPVSGPADFRQIARGWSHGCAVDVNDELYCWGGNEFGQAGVPPSTTTTVSSPTREPLGLTWNMVAAGGDTTCAITTSNKLYCWGDADALGAPTSSGANATPTEIVHEGGWKTVSVSDHVACAVTLDTNQLQCWGDNYHGEVGVGPTGSGRPIHAHAEADL
jgi:alpha-tubulin suppressor-like RCC1 family protein